VAEAFLAQVATRSKFEVVRTTAKSQAAVMSLRPDEEAGAPAAHAGDQWIVAVSGEATVLVWESGPAKDPHQVMLRAPGLLLIPAGTQHHVRCTGKADFVAATVYAPPAYPRSEKAPH